MCGEGQENRGRNDQKEKKFNQTAVERKTYCGFFFFSLPEVSPGCVRPNYTSTEMAANLNLQNFFTRPRSSWSASISVTLPRCRLNTAERRHRRCRRIDPVLRPFNYLLAHPAAPFRFDSATVAGMKKKGINSKAHLLRGGG